MAVLFVGGAAQPGDTLLKLPAALQGKSACSWTATILRITADSGDSVENACVSAKCLSSS